MRAAILVLFASFACARLSAQEADTLYTLTVYTGGGYTRNVSSFEAEPTGLQRDGLAGTLRVMWKPEHLLRLGLETGLTHVYRVKVTNVRSAFGTTDGRSSLNAIPLVIMFSMPLMENLEILAGAGIFILYSSSEAFGSTAVSTVISPAFLASACYLIPLSDSFKIGAELKWYRFDRFDDNNVGLQVLVSYKILEW
jgi:hypothetical protein